MMKIAAQKKRKFQEKSTKIAGVFDSISNDNIAEFAIENVALGAHEGPLISKQLSELNLTRIEDFNSTKQVQTDKDHPIAIAISCRERGCILAEEGNMTAALTRWQEGIFFCPNDHLLHELTAQGFLSLNRNLLALKSALRAVEICPDWTEGLLTLARTQREIGELEASRKTYLRVLGIDERNTIAIQEIRDLQPLLIQLNKRKQELIENVQSSITPDEIEANTCILNLSTRVRIE